jgi:hypothetical protein
VKDAGGELELELELEQPGRRVVTHLLYVAA